VTDRVNHLQGHQFVGQELKRPAPITSGRLAQPQCDQLGFAHTVELRRRGRLLAFLALQSQFKAFGDQAFAETLDRLHAAVESLGDLDVWPRGPIGIRLEQDLSTAKLLRRTFEILDDFLTTATLFVRQPDDILLVHGTPPCAPKFPSNSQNHQPQFLALRTQ
jgi:hypothetical protein